MRRTLARTAACAGALLGALALSACGHGDDRMATAFTHADLAATTNGGIGDADAGRTIFSTNCATCHGATGDEGGIGPSLRGENVRMNYDQTIVWIKHPDPPMPELYPKFLSETEVDDVAAYVQKL
jgi:mono/diheme cytochrome c family protein